MSVVLTVKVEGLIRPPLAQMASTKACYKLGLSVYLTLIWARGGQIDPWLILMPVRSSYVWHSIKLKLLDISDQHVLHMCIKFHVPKLNTHWDIAILWKPLFDFSFAFLNFPFISPARWLESVNTTMTEKRKKGYGSATF